MKNEKQFTITKKIAKHGEQAIVVIPKLLENSLTPGTIVQVTFEIVEVNGEEN
jgi:hypothetical protein